ncbi:hypothetical protein BD311DRAFT_106234, partial [Dichomitus squalens]
MRDRQIEYGGCVAKACRCHRDVTVRGVSTKSGVGSARLEDSGEISRQMRTKDKRQGGHTGHRAGSHGGKATRRSGARMPPVFRIRFKLRTSGHETS